MATTEFDEKPVVINRNSRLNEIVAISLLAIGLLLTLCLVSAIFILTILPGTQRPSRTQLAAPSAPTWLRFCFSQLVWRPFYCRCFSSALRGEGLKREAFAPLLAFAWPRGSDSCIRRATFHLRHSTYIRLSVVRRTDRTCYFARTRERLKLSRGHCFISRNCRNRVSPRHQLLFH